METLMTTSLAGAHNALARDAIAPAVADHTAGAIARMRQIARETGTALLEWQHPGPRAAFSRRDAHRPGFASAVAGAQAYGYEPFIRPVGGRLAMYHEGCLVLDIYGCSSDPRPGTTRRFEIISDALARGLRRLGVDARVGEVPGEYCPGRWSVNANGSRKIVGTGQRLTRDAFLFTAVVVVGYAAPLALAMEMAYRELGYDFEPTTVGSIAEDAPGVTVAEAQEVLGDALAQVLPLDGADVAGGRRLLDPWDPR
jgi:lipoate-protein ligase A